jgi:endoglucanase
LKYIEMLNENIHINQIGYRTKDKKVAIINGRDSEFSIIDEESGTEVLSGRTEGGAYDEASGDTVYYADFSSIQGPGTYYLRIRDFGRSYSFKVGDNIYGDIKRSLLKAFYYQRCGIELEEKHAGLWRHAACHLNNGHVYGHKGKMLDGTGGWHDAGDYGKYTVPGAYAAAYLLLAYEFFPDAFKEEINIPESGNGIPDILNESRFELDWLLKMQDESTGGVYHKLTSLVFPDDLIRDRGITMPEGDTLDLYFFPVSSAATADFAAVMALASRIYSKFDGEFSAKCLQAAEKAWRWLSGNKEPVKFSNPPGVTTGRYGDDNDSDERYWAAAELYRTTGKKEYHEYFIASFEREHIDIGFMWRHVGGMGKIAYLFTDIDKVNKTIYEEIKSEFTDMADTLADMSIKDGYRLSLPPEAYIWGSNIIVSNVAFYLIIAGMINLDDRYVQAIQDHLHYLLGRNALNQCYITGAGSKPIRNPHHRPSEGDGIEEPVPGLVSGGPNVSLQDEYARSRVKGNPPARCFVDHALSFATNEITIYWNAPAVFVAGYFDS